jgi:hypothetical protein
MLLLGLVLGAPLAVVLRLVADHERQGGSEDAPGVARCWAWHMGGWALGAAAGAVLARHVGISSQLLVAALSAIVTAVLAVSKGSRASFPAPSSTSGSAPAA